MDFPMPEARITKHDAACGQLHCTVCTAHLSSPRQRFCSAHCRTRARALRKQLVYCPRCRAPLWLSRSMARRLSRQPVHGEPVQGEPVEVADGS